MKITKEAIKHLSKDPVMKKLVQKHELTPWRNSGDLFLDLINTIISQQLSEKAGDTIFTRFKKMFKSAERISPEAVISIPDTKIRKTGISMMKVKYIKGVARAIISKEISLESFHSLSDEEVIKQLTKLRGIGRWSAEMILMFSVQRPDVFSSGDLGLCTAVSKLYGVDRKDKKKIEEISLTWKPYRSLACRYLWKSLEN